ncbi:four-carbon acid sugar kinase family protein [Bacillus sp. FJAT-49711]|uniref:four-carbon acid sugar kinase family protein n=1 Tax=Bacillus sp. FJAT-49711 TaxID=2833585 RepID=UPI001BC9D3DA|nr:four-carbon acid sugar kinase family protein [Bacillus sp. FJAT-49711]MBS4219518.1 four-carbon acid sugar kinase family protein [Bacillus sp. FJAT-49711]
MNNKIGIIADDFTGSNDSGVQLAKMGLRTSVGIHLEVDKEMANNDVLVIDTNSRSLKSSEAYTRVLRAAQYMFRSGVSHIYKKIDSTLRGNIGIELLAVEKVYEPDIVVIVPAFPKLGRMTKEGHHYINGEIITETEFSKDPITPVDMSYIPDLLFKQVKKKAIVFNSEIIRKTNEEFIQSIHENWIVCDVEKESDFTEIIDKFLKTGLKIVWAGSAGLIEYLPSRLGLETSHLIEMPKYSIGKTLAISGSLSSVTKKQIHEAERMSKTYSIKVDVLELLRHSIDMDTILNKIHNHPDIDHILLYVESNERYPHDQEISKRIVEGIAEMALAICENIESVNGLFLTGGDTAKAVCLKLGIDEMILFTEIEAGLPFGKLLGYKRDLWAVTKAGGFGTKYTLKHALHFLKDSGTDD